MTSRIMKRSKLPQRGYAMLGAIMVIGVAATAALVSTFNATSLHNDQSRRTNGSLALGKQALIASAASNVGHPGALPCPDINNDGIADITAGACTALLGRLPWQTLVLPDVRDSSGERLWYMLAVNFQDIPGNAINPTVNGALNVTGAVVGNSVVAVVVAPGAATGSQARSVANANTASAYLEIDIGVNQLGISAADVNHNDEVALITSSDVFTVVERRVAKEVQLALDTYYNTAATLGRLPQPATSCSNTGTGTWNCPANTALLPAPAVVRSGYLPTDASLVLPAWFDANNWRTQSVRYAMDTDCADGALATCGSAFAGYTVPNGALIGGTAGSPYPGTQALVTFSADNFNTTNLQAASQLALH